MLPSREGGNRPIDVDASRYDCTLEPTAIDGRFAVRLGFRLIFGMKDAEAATLVAGRASVPFGDVEDVWRRSGAHVSTLVRLAEADAFSPSIKPARREALWAIKALRDNPLPLFAVADGEGRPTPETNDEAVRLKSMTAGHEIVEDYSFTGLTLRDHPVSFLRAELAEQRIVTCAEANQCPI